jgi:hypothetical protein
MQSVVLEALEVFLHATVGRADGVADPLPGPLELAQATCSSGFC